MAALEPRSLMISYRHVQHLAEAAAGAAEPCPYEVDARDVDGAPVRIGHGVALLVDLYGPDPYGSLNSFGPRVRRMRAAAMDARTRELAQSWGDELDMCGDRLLLLGELHIQTERGAWWLQPLINAMVINRLARCTVAAVYAPGVYGFRDGGDDVAAMREAGLDFRPLADGVYYLDPATLDLDAVVGRLCAQCPRSAEFGGRRSIGGGRFDAERAVGFGT
jgi:hypothetical protein